MENKSLENVIQELSVQCYSHYKNINQILQCGIDNGIVIKPYCCCECSKIFCKSCVEKIYDFDSKGICPYCEKKGNFSKEENKLVKKLLLNQEVICMFNKQKCDWIGTAEELKAHLQTHITVFDENKQLTTDEKQQKQEFLQNQINTNTIVTSQESKLNTQNSLENSPYTAKRQLKKLNTLDTSSQSGQRKSSNKEGLVCVQTLKEHTQPILSIILLNPNQLATSSEDKIIKIWVSEGKGFQLTQSLKKHTDNVLSLCLLNIQEFASSSLDKTIKVWSKTDNQYQCIQSIEDEHLRPIWSVCQLSNSSFASGSSDKKIKIWKKVKNVYVLAQTLKAHTSDVTTLCLLNDNMFISGSGDCMSKLWRQDKDGYVLLISLKGHTSFITAICQLKDGDIATGSADKTIKIWTKQLNGYQNSFTLKGHLAEVHSVCQVSEGKLASGSRDQTVKIWGKKQEKSWFNSVVNYHCLYTIKEHSAAVMVLCYLNDDKFVSGSKDQSIKIWRLYE